MQQNPAVPLKQAGGGNILLVITTATIIIGRLVGMFIRHPYDDAFITFRYAQNFAAGYGLVYNTGERILGTTSPLFAIILSLPAFFGIDLPLIAQLVNILFDCLTMLLIFHWAKHNSMLLETVLLAIMFAGEPVMVRIPVGAMETSLFLLSSLLAIMLFANRRFLLAGLLSAGTYFLRPEALLLSGIFLIILISNRQFRVSLLMVLLETAIIIPPLLFFWHYYGSPFPNSVIAKAAQLSGSILPILRDEFFINPLHIIILPFAVWGAMRGSKKSPFLGILTLWGAVYFSAYLILRPQIWGWYFFAPYFVKFLLAAVGIVDLFQRYFKKVRLTPISLAIIGSFLVIITGLVIAVKVGRSPVSRYVYTPLRNWFKEHPAKGKFIAAGDIGAIGYYSRAHIYDLNGLVSPRLPGNSIEKVKLWLPDYLFLGVFKGEQEIALSPGIAEKYIPVKRFSRFGESNIFLEKEEIPSRWRQDYILYQRNEPR